MSLFFLLYFGRSYSSLIWYKQYVNVRDLFLYHFYQNACSVFVGHTEPVYSRCFLDLHFLWILWSFSSGTSGAPSVISSVTAVLIYHACWRSGSFHYWFYLLIIFTINWLIVSSINVKHLKNDRHKLKDLSFSHKLQRKVSDIWHFSLKTCPKRLIDYKINSN